MSVAAISRKNQMLLACLAGCLLLLVSHAHAARQVSAKRECATCHIMWLDEFKRKDVKSLIPYDPKPVTKSGKQDVSSTERMCFSCHDGFVLDDRYMWKDDAHWHPTGVKPPKGMKVHKVKGKRVFPLNEDGKVYCGTCHSAHGVDWSDKDATIFLRIKNVESKLCLGCHEKKGEGPKTGNHPVFKAPTEKPTELIEAGGKLGRKGKVICQSCHRPHGGKQEAMLVISNKKAGLCYTCHKDKRGVVDSKHDMTIMAPHAKNIDGDDVSQTGPCSACHVPHGGKGPGLWARNIPPEEKDKTAAMCTTCHTKDGIAKEKLTGLHSHPLNLELDKLGISVNKKGWSSKHSWAKGKDGPEGLPLYDKHGQRTTKQGLISCPTCHDPHNWSVKEELKKVADPKESEGNGDTSFLRIAQGKDSKLCMNCHIDKRTIKQTTHNIEQSISDKKETSQEKSETEETLSKSKDTCMHCHAVHNAKGITLRGRDKGPGKTAIETWCKDCHQKDGLAKDKLIAEHSHPLGVHPEHLAKNSALPLFDKEGKRTDHEGLVDCASCHNPHQWTSKTPNPSKNKARKKETEGNSNNSYLRQTASRDAKLCASCHKDKALVIGTDHDMRVTAKTAANAFGQSTYQSGVCGQCHAIHNPEMKNNLWARKPGEGHDVKEQQCRSCHTKKGVAKDKVPPALQHPEEVMAWSGETRELVKQNELPEVLVYDKEGKETHAGFITCPSCHNPHQWDPRKEAAGPGKNVEGNALTSFLRNKNSEFIVCADCHGKDALFRYKYYHGEASRKDHPLYR